MPQLIITAFSPAFPCAHTRGQQRRRVPTPQLLANCLSGNLLTRSENAGCILKDVVTDPQTRMRAVFVNKRTENLASDILESSCTMSIKWIKNP
jgi:hypothetical protein